MFYLKIIAVLIIFLAVVYFVLKIVENSREYQTNDHKPLPNEIEIVSRDLKIKAENLLSMSEVYELQLIQYKHEIDNIDQKLRTTPKNSDIYHTLVGRSLRIQERKCIVESKIIKINRELSEIAIEEYKRQMWG
jgi:hypothetical protein